MLPNETPRKKRRSLFYTIVVFAGRAALTLCIAAALFTMLNRVWAAGVTSGDTWWSSAAPAGSGFNTPTATGTHTTPTATTTPCGATANYQVTTGAAAIVAGITDIGSHCDDCDTAVSLPFPYTLYDQVFNSVNVSSNGRLDFATVNEPGGYANACLPAPSNLGPYNYTIFAYWDDLTTANAGYGVFTSVSGATPNRVFNIEWRAQYFPAAGNANFEVRLYENQKNFNVIYGTVTGSNTSATSGVQKSNTIFTQYFCNSSGGAASGSVSYAQPVVFSDVHPNDYFYIPVLYLYCHGAISGYADGTFRPGNLTTRGQLCKIIVLAEGWTIYTPPNPTFQDVPANYTFYQYIETAYHQGIISGYACGAGCLNFRPGNSVTRGQLCKIIVLAESWALYTPPSPTFQDVPSSDPFYQYIETAYSHGIVSGYACGTGCLEFRPGNNATRGQICKIVYGAVGP